MHKKDLWFWLTILFAGIALVASAVLLVDYVRPAPVFCDAAGGCGRVKATAFAKPFGVPLPVFGIAGILAIALAALIPGREARIAQAGAGAMGGLFAIMLIGVQGSMGVICPYCAIVDTSTIVLAVLSIYRWRRALDPPPERWITGTTVVACVAALGVPVAIGFQKRILPQDVPYTILEEMRRSGNSKVTIVDFVDFECPFCRMTHAELQPLLEEEPTKNKVRLVRKHVPLRMHPHALDAAKAGCCGEALGKGDEMADALFRTEPEELTPEGCEKLAKEHGLDVDRFRACVRDPATQARIDKDKETFRAVEGHGLPTIWVDGTKLEGAQDRTTLKATIDAAIRAL
jgi:protein-disulfide isomerase/uncharacterized membrane protein